MMTLQTLLFHLQKYILKVLQIHILDRNQAILWIESLYDRYDFRSKL